MALQQPGRHILQSHGAQEAVQGSVSHRRRVSPPVRALKDCRLLSVDLRLAAVRRHRFGF